MNKSTKIGWMAGIFAIGLAATSCSNNAIKDAPDNGNKEVTALTVHITNNDKSLKSGLGNPGTDEDGVGDEIAVSNESWGVYAASGDGLYRFYKATDQGDTNTGTDDVANVPKALIGSTAYVIVNGEIPTDLSLTYTEDQVKALTTKFEKTTLNDFSSALQTANAGKSDFTGAPDFSGLATKAMLMTGSGVVPSADAQGHSSLPVDVNRQFAKVELTIDPTPGPDATDISDLTIDKIVFEHVNPNVNYFNETSAVPTPIVPDFDPTKAGPNQEDFFQPNAINNANVYAGPPAANEYRYIYDVDTNFKWKNTPAYVSCYTTPNFASSKDGGTLLVIRATVKAKWDGTTDTEKTRYYRAYIADKTGDKAADWTSFQTNANAIYKINATINSKGNVDPDDKTTNLDVTVHVAKWNTFDVDTNFQ